MHVNTTLLMCHINDTLRVEHASSWASYSANVCAWFATITSSTEWLHLCNWGGVCATFCKKEDCHCNTGHPTPDTLDSYCQAVTLSLAFNPNICLQTDFPRRLSHSNVLGITERFQLSTAGIASKRLTDTTVWIFQWGCINVILPQDSLLTFKL